MFQYLNLVDPFAIHILKFSGIIEEDNIKLYKEKFQEIFSINQKFYIIFDISEVSNFELNHGFLIFDTILSKKEEFQNNIIASSIITNNLCKSAIDIIFGMNGKLSENKIVNNFDDAIKYLCEFDVLLQSKIELS